MNAIPSEWFPIEFHYFRKDLLFIYNVDTFSIVSSFRWIKFAQFPRWPTILSTRLLIQIAIVKIFQNI